jgi:hypothetical protein
MVNANGLEETYEGKIQHNLKVLRSALLFEIIARNLFEKHFLKSSMKSDV